MLRKAKTRMRLLPEVLCNLKPELEAAVGKFISPSYRSYTIFIGAIYNLLWYMEFPLLYKILSSAVLVLRQW